MMETAMICVWFVAVVVLVCVLAAKYRAKVKNYEGRISALEEKEER